MATFKTVVETLNLSLTFPQHHGSRATRQITDRERALQPPLTTVVHDDVWLQTLVTNLETYDQKPLSAATIQRISNMMLHETICVIPRWTQEESQVEGFLNILRTAAVVVEDLLDLDQNSILAAGQVSRQACIPDMHAHDDRELTLLTVEVKTPDVLNEEDWAIIREKTNDSASWAEGTFAEDVTEHAASMVVQTWCQSVYESFQNPAGQVVTPRYCGLTNYNKTIFGRRGTGSDYIAGNENTLYVTDVFEPNGTFLALVAILLHQMIVKPPLLQRVRNCVGDDFYAASQATLSKLPNPAEDAKDKKSDFADRKQEILQLSYSFNVRTSSGMPFMFTKDLKLLHRGKRPEVVASPPLRPASSGSQSSIGSPNLSSIPHLTIITHLGEGIVGEVFLAQCQEKLIVWKEVDPAKEEAQGGDSAWREAALYEGPLATLQGSVVPHFYGAYHKTADEHIVLLMEYVGKRLSEATWEEVASGVRIAAEEKLRKVAAAGVHHGDFEPRNVCVTGGGDVRIIDFSHSTLIHST